MKTPSIGLTGSGVLGLAGIAVAAYLAYRIYRAGGAVGEAVSGAVESAKKTAMSIVDFIPSHIGTMTENTRMEETDYDAMGNVIGTKAGALEASQARYARPPITSSTQVEGDAVGAISFAQQGRSFKDLSDPSSINPWLYTPRPVDFIH